MRPAMLARPLSSLVLALAVSLGMLLPAPAAADVASVMLEVPWRTQIDGQADQHQNGGLAGVGMVLSAYGYGATTTALRSLHDHLAGAAHAPVDAVSLSRLTLAMGLVPQTIDPNGADPLAEVRRHLEGGRPVLLRLGDGEKPLLGHWVVVVGYLSRGDLVGNDPAEPRPLFGQTRLLTRAEQVEWLRHGAVGVALGLGGLAARVEPSRISAPTREATTAAERVSRAAFEAQTLAEVPDGAAATAGNAQAAPDGSPYWWHLIETYAGWFGLDPYYVAAVVLAESGGDPNAVGDYGHSIGLMQLHDQGFGAGLFDARFDPALNLWHGTKALAGGMARFSDPYESYARYYNPGGQVAGERVMAWYAWLRALGDRAQR